MPTPQVDLTTRAPQLFYLDSGVAVFRSTVSPEGVIEARKDSICVYNGAPYIKTTDTGNTGWLVLQFAPSLSFQQLLVANTSNTQTSGTGQDPLTSVVIPANTLNFDGARWLVSASGNFNGVAGNKRLLFRFDGSTICFDTGLFAINDSNWHLTVEITRLLGGSVLVVAKMSANTFGATATPVERQAVTFIGPGVLFTVAHTLDFEAEVANAADSVSQGACLVSVL